MAQERKQSLIQVARRTLGRTDLSGNAAALAYYSLLALIPILLLVANLIPLLPLDPMQVIAYVEELLPTQVAQLLEPILLDYLANVSTGAISLSLLLSIWSASVSFSSLQRTLNAVYGRSAAGNPLTTRLFSFLVTLLLVLFVGAGVALFVFGRTAVMWLGQYLPLPLDWLEALLSFRLPLLLGMLFLLYLFIYALVPSVRRPLRYSVFGAGIAALLSLLLSQLFEGYVVLFGGQSVGNGTLGVFIILMLYFYLSALVINIGAIVNVIHYERDHTASVTAQSTVRQTDSETFETLTTKTALAGDLKGENGDDDAWRGATIGATERTGQPDTGRHD